MSLSKDTMEKHLNDPAIFCCQRKKGLVISEADLEDPMIFPDLVESQLLTLTDDGLTIKEVLGKTLKTDTEALTPITASMLEENIKHQTETECLKSGKESAEKETSINEVDRKFTGGDKMIHLEIDELKGLKLDIPLHSIKQFGFSPAEEIQLAAGQVLPEPQKEDKVIRTLHQKEYQVKKILLGDSTSFESGVLTINKGIIKKAKDCNPLVKEVEMDIITPDNHHIFTNTIMDIIPIAAKVNGRLGEGETAVISGAVFCLTGLDEKGVQIHEFGSCEGYIDEKIAFGRPGCPDDTDIMIRINVIIQEGTGMERRGPFAAHCACDVIIQEIREVLKKTKEPVYKEDIFRDVHKYGRPRVVLVKEIMGQGAMHDNIICPTEPSGVPGGQKNVDLGNIPVMLSPNEVLDGGIHALTCIGPATKEMTRHYFREPLVKALAQDNELDLVGVIFIGSPQVNDEKTFVTERLGALIETLDLKGAIVTTEGFGNNHIDFAGNIAAIGSRDIPVVGVTFSAYQGQLVVGNKYMDAMIELNKDPEGFENEVLGCSSICPEDAKRAILMLKTKMAGIPIEPANRKWSQAVIDANQILVK
ncbi:D-proline reductase (dithiol) proprotein PrdA [Anaerocolumna sp. MB42-C2]|uniref:D-proline reductase (dithiol) proprotein PrdA n=1 Tax=Anaerocolumna sp. MB42-C2 TaxID=3070997 RepID=UPI0027E10563|nr:D-proline reductase (dithiol) proprotein PrdA [Anaerocolumna sp. MB42-C2]WMJ88187.1 D-proline reductase (dithiol) proprotein PrdA [Anaerocolumna sp. MB42-C2]